MSSSRTANQNVTRDDVAYVNGIVNRLAGPNRGHNHDELVATGLLGLAEAAESYRPEGGASFRTLLTIHVRGRVIDQMRRHNRWFRKDRETGEAVFLNTDLNARASSATLAAVFRQEGRTMESAMTRRELVSRLCGAMKRLPPELQEVLQLHYFESKDTDEISAATGVCRRIVNKRLRLAKDALKEALSFDEDESGWSVA